MTKEPTKTSGTNEAHAALTAFLSDGEDRPETCGITLEKLFARAEWIDDPEYPEWLAFNMVRHHPALGCHYRKGLPMSAYVECRHHYAFDPVGHELHDLGPDGQNILHVENFDQAASDFLEDTSFKIKDLGNGQYRIVEECGNDEGIVASLSEARDFARKSVSTLCYDGLTESLGAFTLDPKSVEAALAEFKETCCEIAECEAEDAWRMLE